jgi:hypothetical protein
VSGGANSSLGSTGGDNGQTPVTWTGDVPLHPFASATVTVYGDPSPSTEIV